jgi:flagellar biosynthesis GTPase FlhF
MRSDDDMRSDYVPNFARRKPEYSTTQIVLGVAGGILLAGAIGFFVRLYMVKTAVETIVHEVNKTTVQMQRQTQETAQRIQQQNEQRMENLRRQEEQRRQQLASIQRAQYAAQMAEQSEKARKEDAWAKFYKKPAHCDTAEGQAFIECANSHIRAKRKFDELWAAGKL